jgi:hypothetical protein
MRFRPTWPCSGASSKPSLSTGSGLYIYAGEDLPEGEPEPKISAGTSTALNVSFLWRHPDNCSKELIWFLQKRKSNSLDDLTEDEGQKLIAWLNR